jgi:hypothetical protein
MKIVVDASLKLFLGIFFPKNLGFSLSIVNESLDLKPSLARTCWDTSQALLAPLVAKKNLYPENSIKFCELEIKANF